MVNYMNVYDFDETIYDGDSSIDFYLYCLRKRPIIIFFIFKQAYGVLLKKLKIINTKSMKEYFFSFLKKLDNVDELVNSFWKINDKKIKKWYLKSKKSSDLVISASPDFLISPICRKLKIRDAIATKMDINTGKIIGENCKGKEKVNRFYKEYPNGKILKFYSDSYTDTPLKEISNEAYLVKENNLSSW